MVYAFICDFLFKTAEYFFFKYFGLAAFPSHVAQKRLFPHSSKKFEGILKSFKKPAFPHNYVDIKHGCVTLEAIRRKNNTEDRLHFSTRV